MGAVWGKKSSEEQKQQHAKSREIDKQLQKEKNKAKDVVKLLLLGTGASGKSTIAKQMQILYLNGFKTEEKELYKQLIAEYIVENMQILIKGADELDFDLDENNEEDAQSLLDLDPNDINTQLPKSHAKIISRLWKDEGIQKAFEHRNKLQLSDSASYFFSDVNRFARKGFSPSEEDILRVRIRTTGILETKFKLAEYSVRLMDVGGQRSERRKWMNCFDDVKAIIFVVALNEYDKLCEEDDETNRMEEALKVFEETINNKWFNETPIILFLNKLDLFEAKIKEVDLGDFFSEYKGGKDKDKALKWVGKRFLDCNQNPKREIFNHPTIGISTKNVETVFNSIQRIIVSEAVSDIGFDL